MRQPVIHIIDDDLDVLSSLSFMLRSGKYQTQSYSSAEQFLSALENSKSGCILLDLRMPGMNGLELQKRLVEQGCNWPVIIITGHGDVDSAVQAMKAGAVDFLQKPFSKADLDVAIEKGMSQLIQTFGADDEQAKALKRLDVLSRRETEVLQELARGLANKEIARKLGISPRTVEVHRANASHKLDIRNNAELLLLAFEAGMQNNHTAT